MKCLSRMAKAGLGAFITVGILAWTRIGTANGNPVQPANQINQYDAEVPKTAVELQQFRETTSLRINMKNGREGAAALTNLNPAINAMYLLKIAWKDSNSEAAYYLENPKPQTQKLLLDDKNSTGLMIVEGTNRYFCDLFGTGALGSAASSPLIFQPLCGNRIYLRNSATGHRTTLEAGTEFFREHIWGGEKIVALGHILMGDMHRETGRIVPQTGPVANAEHGAARGLPLAALIDSKYADRLLTSSNLGIVVEGPQAAGMTPGTWHAASGNPGVYVSILQPNLIDPPILQSYKTAVNTLESIESSALCYLIAFDLDRFDLGYAPGTKHPTVAWSDRTIEKMRNPKLPGPDGIGTIQPLVATGLVSPENAQKTVATFTGGFKRAHGAFRYGDLSLRNHGSHYGFIENGVVFSKLQPGLATILVLDDGSVEMKTWTEAGNKRLARIRHARQNGVAIIERDNASQSPIPSALVRQWGPGNWSGSEEGKLRTMRSGAALQNANGRRFLIYAVFSDATPSAMARIFQAYRCDYAMLLDMNALEHTYLALYRRTGSQMFVDHLLKGMSALEKSASGELVPRFLGYADNRDFFYVMRRAGKEVKP